MKLPLSWLLDYTNFDIDPKEYSRRMTMSGSKVEGIEYLGAEIENVKVGKILSIEKHPDADKLSVCRVDVGGKEPVSIITAAKNVNTGDLVPVALDHAKLPGGILIQSSEMRGMLSEGMLCSFHELLLTQNDVPYAADNGILILPEECKAAPGQDIKDVLGFDEYVCEFEITSNRPDCLSVIGIARETAATYDTPFAVEYPVVKGCGGNIEDYLSVEIKNPGLCPRYSAAVVKNIRVAPSPKWLRERLRACGVRPINNIVAYYKLRNA